MLEDQPMIKAIIFDLDNCLSAADEPGSALLEPVFDAIRQANRGTLPNDMLETALADCWYHALDFVAKKHSFSDEMLAAGWDVISQTRVTTLMRGYGDLQVLAELRGEPLPMLFLVTSGFRQLQDSKVKALSVEQPFEQWFTRIYIDAVDEPNRTSKQDIFQTILNTHQFSPAEVLVVGDNPDSELAAGDRLGIPTVQILRPGVAPSTLATHHIRTLHELKALVFDQT